MADAERKLRVFLCHAKEDKPTVREFYSKLSAEGWVDVWLDEIKLLPGQEWDIEIEKATEQSDVVLVCLSTGSVNKEGYVQKEIRFVLNIADEKPEGAIFIVPVRLDDCRVPRRLNTWQWVDYFPETDKESTYKKILESLKIRAQLLGISTENPIMSISPSPASSVPIVPNRLRIGGIELIRIPAGEFIMGSGAGNQMSSPDEQPQHRVMIPYDYWICRFPITNRQYSRLVDKSFSKGKDAYPVIDVSWNDAQKYTELLNDRYSDILPANYQLRLPTEAEWEKAARGTDGREWPWGNEFDAQKCNCAPEKFINISKHFLRPLLGGFSIVPVGHLSPQGDSPYGVADMAGNVWEWTHSLSKSYPYSSDDGREDQGHGAKILKVFHIRVIRGGSWWNGKSDVRCANRRSCSAIQSESEQEPLGFRVVAAPSLWQYIYQIKPA